MNNVKNKLTFSTDMPLVFLHGWGSNARIWAPFLDQISSVFTNVRAIDLPGYGQNAESLATVNLDQNILAQVSEAIDKQIDTECILVGWSLGGIVASFLALNSPNKYKALINICSSPCFVAKRGWAGIDEIVLDNFSLQLERDVRSLLKRFVSLQTMGLQDQKSQNRLILDSLFSHPLPDRDALRLGLRILKHTDMRQQFTTLIVPSLTILGEKDRLIPTSLRESLNAINDKISVRIVKKASHAPFLSHPGEVITLIRNFLNR